MGYLKFCYKKTGTYSSEEIVNTIKKFDLESYLKTMMIQKQELMTAFALSFQKEWVSSIKDLVQQKKNSL